MVQGTGTTNSYVDAYDAYKTKVASNQNQQGENNDTKKVSGKKDDEAVISSQGAEAAGKDGWSKDVAKAIQDEYKQFQAQLVQSMLKASGIDGGKFNWSSMISSLPDENSENAMTLDELIAAMPEAWRPDAVAERIVNFSTAFYEKSGLSGEEFYEKIKASIDAGFGGANKEMEAHGKLPGNIKSVMEATRQAVYAKLDAWAESMGIQIPYTGEDKVN